MARPHIPAWRFGKRYESLDVETLTDYRGRDDVADVSMTNAGLIRKDVKKVRSAFDQLQSMDTARMLEVCRDAAARFRDSTLPLSEDQKQSPRDYVAQLSSTTGLPWALCRTNMEKICGVLESMEEVLRGLTRSLNMNVLDHGIDFQDGQWLGYVANTPVLGAVLPSNSPGVNGLWLPALALRVPVLVKPGREDPWTPWRLVQALIEAGCPGEALGYYPASHEGGAAVVETCGRSMIFGDRSTVDRYTGKSAVSVHGPGYSKILLDDQASSHQEEFLDMVVLSMCANSGRSCINASTLVVTQKGDAWAQAIADRVAGMKPLPLDHPDAALAGFARPNVAESIDQGVTQKLEEPGATDVTDDSRETSRRVEKDGVHYLLPTVIRCDRVDHPLARTEYLFPFLSVVEMPREKMLNWIGPTLIATVVTQDQAWKKECIHCAHIDRLNLGPLPTTQIKWDQPHEGNLFELLYRRRAVQVDER